MGGDYQREPQQFFQQMPLAKQQAFLQHLRSEYRQILLTYFTKDITATEKINNFINISFQSNLPIPKIIEMHMELIDEFSKQLKLEGRNDDVLLDYRLVLIDVLAHLCETYRTATKQ